MDIQEKLRKIVQELLEKKEVDTVIGYEEGDLPMRTTPCFIRLPENADKLVWNSLCENNLSQYLIGRDGKTAIVAKSCDIRSIIILINEKQIQRENIKIIGMPCKGTLDRLKIYEYFANDEINYAKLDGDILHLESDIFSKDLKVTQFLHDNCFACRYRNPILFDIIVGDKAAEDSVKDEYAEIKALENKTPEERWKFFTKELSRCNRCYACRQACPLCYCKSCFVDQNFPAWFGKGNNISDTVCFHLLRALHTAGRCLDCGACTRACPQHIKLRLLTKKIEKDIQELFGTESGITLDEISPLASFDENDPQDFINK
jgi:formate dehydrogenase (coenzyme F420) beta subunit